MRRPLRSALQRLVVWCTMAALVVAPVRAEPNPQAAAAAHAEGLAAGQAVQPTVRSALQAPSASAVVPGYTTTPAERTYYGQPQLSGASDARLSECLLTPADPVCQALLAARASAQTPREPVGPYDPAVLGASRVAGNPASVLEDLASFYSGCQVDTTTAPATEQRVCRRYSSAAPQSCSRALSVAVSRTNSCTPGNWFAEAGTGSLTLGLQCKPDLPTSSQRMRITNRGTPLAFFDADVAAGWVFPQAVLQVPGANTSHGPRHLWLVDNRCDGDRCQLTAYIAEATRTVCSGTEDSSSCSTERPFLEVYGACPAGTRQGDQLEVIRSDEASGTVAATLDQRYCYAPSRDPDDQYGRDTTGASTSMLWRKAGMRPVVGYRLNPLFGPNPPLRLAFERPHTTVTETDHWTEDCPAALGSGRCTAASAPRCVDGPATKQVDGAAVTRACWRYETDLSCQFGQATDECAPLAAAGCTAGASTCRETDPVFGQCRVTEQTYACPVAPANTATARNCPADVFCLGGNCFNTSHPADTDFARTMTFLEAAREAGVYLDTDRMQVFKGESNRCRDRLFKDCCTSDGAGRGMHNQSLFGVGSKLVFDVLMNAENRAFVYYGLRALLLNGGFHGTFTSYGVTVAVNGAALPAGSSVLYAGESVVVAFDPWSLVIAIIFYVVMSFMSCDAEEATLAMKEGARLCHKVGTYCSSCIRVLGACVACTTYTTRKCCFNSALARIIHEQGRQQFGKTWGTARAPDCSGFTVAQLQQLDFSRMDFTEFYASIAPTLPNASAIQSRQLQRASGCYYGEGRCP